MIKYLLVLFCMCILPLFASYSPEVVEITPTDEGATWSYQITIQQGQSVDMIQFSKAGFANAWCSVISGRIKLNNDIETTYCSWQVNSTAVVFAVTDAVLIVQGN